MLGNVSWGGDTCVEGVEHVEASEKYRELCTCHISCLTVRISAENAASEVIWIVQIVYFFQILSRLA